MSEPKIPPTVWLRRSGANQRTHVFYLYGDAGASVRSLCGIYRSDHKNAQWIAETESKVGRCAHCVERVRHYSKRPEKEQAA